VRVEDIEKVVRKYFDLLNQERLEELLSVFHEEAEVKFPILPNFRGRTEIAKFYQGIIKNYPVHADIPTEIYVKGNRAAVEILFEGTFKNGKELRFTVVDIFQFEGNQIKQLQAYYDGHQLLKDLGASK